MFKTPPLKVLWLSILPAMPLMRWVIETPGLVQYVLLLIMEALSIVELTPKGKRRSYQ